MAGSAEGCSRPASRTTCTSQAAALVHWQALLLRFLELDFLSSTFLLQAILAKGCARTGFLIPLFMPLGQTYHTIIRHLGLGFRV